MLHLKLVNDKNNDKTTSRNVLCISAPEDRESLTQKTVIVIDYSGSMSSDATPGLPDSERDGISILMLIIHCIKVVIGCYNKKDSIAIVCFNENAKLYFPMTKMTDANKNSLLSKLDSITPNGSTRIWSGIKMGLDTLKNSFQVNEQCNQTIMVFTDGLDESANKPLRGNIYELDGFIRANSDWCNTITMNTVGFGNKLDSKELFDMAERLNGTFSHIPESSTAGTIMINRLATDLTTYGNNIRVIATMKDSSVSSTNIGSICVGQNRTHPICHSLDDVQKIEVSMFNGLTYVVTQVDLTSVTEDKKTVLECWTKLDLITTIEHNIDTIQTTSPTVSLPYCTVQFANFRKRNEMNNSYPYIKDCLKDVDDQLRKAVEKEKWCAAWGLHYLRSYLHTTRKEIVNNFRDYAIQHFASNKFTDLQTRCEKIFLATPPIPKKTPVARTNTYTSTPTLNPTIDTSSNASFENRYFGSCFDPNSSILMSDGTVKDAGDVKKGDLVSCGDNRVASVRCVTFSTGLFEMVDIDGFALTSTHPVRSLDPKEDKWVRPKDISSNRYEYDKVVNFLLDAHHEIVGVCSQSTTIRCCTLAHGLKGEVIEHDYLGTDKVARDLEQIPGFDSGVLCISFTRENEYISGVKSN
jgi:hypothetical protein